MPPLPGHPNGQPVQRRNKPTAPTTKLPLEGRKGDPPALPEASDLGPAGLAWWEWAWHTPQACGWSDGDLYTVVRRAQLEDGLAALGSVDDGLDLSVLDEVDERLGARVSEIIGRLRGLAGSQVTVSKAATELEDRLGLTAKAMAQLRWTIVAPDAEEKPKAGSQGRKLKAV